MKTRVWKLTVNVEDNPKKGKKYKSIDEIIDYINKQPEVGFVIKVTDYEDYGLFDED